MSEEAWYKMLAVSVALHIIIIGAFSIPIKFSSKKIDLSGSYSVNLVGSSGNLGGGGGGPKVQSQAKPEPKPKQDKPAPAIKEKKIPPKKPQPMEKEDDAVSLSKKKPPKTKTTREEVDRLEERIQNIRKKTDYIDVAKAGSGGPGKGGGGGGGGLPGSGGGSGAPLDPAMQKYLLDVWEKIKNAWNVPGMAKKDLETIVLIKIRKDGRIVDINIEKRSGNRVYDESVLRVLRAVEPLPPIPSSLNTDALEVGFRFLPGGIS
ncbi:MAG: TonB family protein [Deltaproteobacteria bacterium]|nr:TonB family protein [Deltaproteobacteria bacterium]